MQTEERSALSGNRKLFGEKTAGKWAGRPEVEGGGEQVASPPERLLEETGCWQGGEGQKQGRGEGS